MNLYSNSYFFRKFSMMKFLCFLLFFFIFANSLALADNILRLNIRGESSGTIDILLDERNAPKGRSYGAGIRSF